MLYYSTNPSVKTVCSLHQKVERIADEVMLTAEFSAMRTELYRDHNYSCSSFEQDVKDLVFRYLHLEKADRKQKLAALYNAVCREIIRNYI